MLAPADLEFISRLSVFAGIASSSLDVLRPLAVKKTLAAGDVLCREGEPAKEMVVVVSGQLSVIKRGPAGGEAIIAHLGPGDVAGEMSLIDIQPRSADLRADQPTELIVLSHASIAELYRQDPEGYHLLVRNIAREISLRLRRLDEMLAKVISEIHRTTSR